MECPRRGCARWKALKTRATPRPPPPCWQSRLAPLDNARYCTSTMQVLYSPVSPFSTGEKTHCFVSLLAFASFQTLLILFTRPSLSPSCLHTIQKKEEERERKRDAWRFRARDDLLNEEVRGIYICQIPLDRFSTKRIFPLFRHRYGIISRQGEIK